jgi:hypothetical protein
MTAHIPKNVMGLEELCQAERLNWENVQRTVKQMLAIMRAKADTMGFTSWKAWAAHYNNAANNLITSSEVNTLIFHSKLEPIAFLIKMYVTDGVSNTKNKGEKVTYTNFGILRSQYLYYRKHGVPPQVADRGRAREHFSETGENARTKIAIDLTQTPTYKAFAAYVKRTPGATIPQAVAMLIEDEVKGDPESYGIVEQQIAPENRIRVKNNTNIRVDISSETMQALSAVIARRNSANTVKFTQSQIVEEAILHYLNNHVDLAIRDPALARELEGIG